MGMDQNKFPIRNMSSLKKEKMKLSSLDPNEPHGSLAVSAVVYWLVSGGAAVSGLNDSPLWCGGRS